MIERVRFWGSPWQPAFFQWAFNLPRREAPARAWSQIRDDVEVLVTHTPPHRVRDQVVHGRRDHVDCADLRRRLNDLRSLRLHVFGHVHEEYGESLVAGRRFGNASSTTVNYEPVNEPIIVDLKSNHAPSSSTHLPMTPYIRLQEDRRLCGTHSQRFLGRTLHALPKMIPRIGGQHVPAMPLAISFR